MSTSSETQPRTKRPRRGIVVRPGGREEGVIDASVPVGLAKDVRIYCAENRRTLKSVVAKALQSFLDAEDAAVETARAKGQAKVG